MILLIISLTMFSINVIKIVEITGHATGTANLTIEQKVEINFTTNSINWASGSVTVGQSKAILVSNNTVTNGNWTANSAGLVLENIGNENASLVFVTTQTGAAAFIGGTSPEYQWNFSNVEASSCTFNATTTVATFYDANSTYSRQVCNVFNVKDSIDTLRVDIRLLIPSDATNVGTAIGDTIVVTATAV